MEEVSDKGVLHLCGRSTKGTKRMAILPLNGTWDKSLYTGELLQNNSFLTLSGSGL